MAVAVAVCCVVQAELKYNLAGKGEHMEKAKMDAYKQYRQQAKVNTRARGHCHSRAVNWPRK